MSFRAKEEPDKNQLRMQGRQPSQSEEGGARTGSTWPCRARSLIMDHGGDCRPGQSQARRRLEQPRSPAHEPWPIALDVGCRHYNWRRLSCHLSACFSYEGCDQLQVTRTKLSWGPRRKMVARKSTAPTSWVSRTSLSNFYSGPQLRAQKVLGGNARDMAVAEAYLVGRTAKVPWHCGSAEVCTGLGNIERTMSPEMSVGVQR